MYISKRFFYVVVHRVLGIQMEISEDSRNLIVVGAFIIGGVALAIITYFMWKSSVREKEIMAGIDELKKKAWLPTYIQ